MEKVKRVNRGDKNGGEKWIRVNRRGGKKGEGKKEREEKSERGKKGG